MENTENDLVIIEKHLVLSPPPTEREPFIDADELLRQRDSLFT